MKRSWPLEVATTVLWNFLSSAAMLRCELLRRLAAPTGEMPTLRDEANLTASSLQKHLNMHSTFPQWAGGTGLLAMASQMQPRRQDSLGQSRLLWALPSLSSNSRKLTPSVLSALFTLFSFVLVFFSLPFFSESSCAPADGVCAPDTGVCASVFTAERLATLWAAVAVPMPPCSSCSSSSLQKHPSTSHSSTPAMGFFFLSSILARNSSVQIALLSISWTLTETTASSLHLLNTLPLLLYSTSSSEESPSVVFSFLVAGAGVSSSLCSAAFVSVGLDEPPLSFSTGLQVPPEASPLSCC